MSEIFTRGEEMKIRLAAAEDIPKMREVFDIARAFQLENGIIQWAEGYPSEELILEDIALDAAYLAFNKENELIGVLSVFTEPDPTYFEIDGEWLNDASYTTVHRIASNGKEKSVGQNLLKWVQERYSNIRIDTHKDNQPMKHVLNKLDFQYTGVITLENGEFRDAYHYVKEKEN